MTKFNELLELKKEKHEELGEVFVLYSEEDSEGRGAFFVEEKTYEHETKSGKRVNKKYDSAVAIRISKKTAKRLANQILKELEK